MHTVKLLASNIGTTSKVADEIVVVPVTTSVPVSVTPIDVTFRLPVTVQAPRMIASVSNQRYILRRYRYSTGEFVGCIIEYHVEGG